MHKKKEENPCPLHARAHIHAYAHTRACMHTLVHTCILFLMREQCVNMIEKCFLMFFFLQEVDAVVTMGKRHNFFLF